MEWINITRGRKWSDLRTEDSTYWMQVKRGDTLVHLYYGSP